MNTIKPQQKTNINRPVSLHDILVAWQKGTLSARLAMQLSGIDNIGELYVAAASSGVRLRKTLLPAEAAAAQAATDSIKAKLKTLTPKTTEKNHV
jgi:hypothetical protein